MRTLKFIVDGQIISQDPTCDFSSLVPGTEGYLQAEFSCSSEWDGCVKVAAFYSQTGKELDAKALMDGKTCIIPAKVLKKQTFRIRLIGKRDGFKIRTDRVTVTQNGGKE